MTAPAYLRAPDPAITRVHIAATFERWAEWAVGVHHCGPMPDRIDGRTFCGAHVTGWWEAVGVHRDEVCSVCFARWCEADTKGGSERWPVIS